MVAKTVERFGQLDAAFNNAGIENDPMPLAEISAAAFDRLLAINVRGVYLCMKWELPAMLRRGKGAIVNTASAAGLVGAPGLSPYAASKHAVVGLTKSASAEYASAGVRVNAVCPGLVRTPMLERLEAKVGADAFQAFREAGNIFDRKTASKLKKFVYAAGNRQDALEAYVAFRGRPPKIEGLLKKRGLAA